MAAYGRVDDSRHLQAKNRDQLWNPTLGYRVWATFPCLISGCDRRMVCAQIRVYDIGLVELDWVRVNCRGGLLTTGLKMWMIICYALNAHSGR